MQTDPLQEKQHEVLPGVIWKYDNRALVLLTHDCPSNCQFCFRKFLYEENTSRASNEELSSFIATHPQITELIFSGGEPLLCVDDIQDIASQLSMSQLTRLRIHTRLPITFPEKVDVNGLTKLVKKSTKPWYLVIHTNHPAELQRLVTRQVISSLRKAGYILLSHTVFLKGVNDSVETLARLFEDLVDLGVKPYYIFHCDNMPHTQSMIIPLEEERRIMSELRKVVSGLAYPLHVIDSESGKGKIPVPTAYWQADLTQYRDFAEEVNQVSK